MTRYMLNLLMAWSCLVNALIGGVATETVCARAYRCKWTLFIRGMNLLHRDHCEWAARSNRGAVQRHYRELLS